MKDLFLIYDQPGINLPSKAYYQPKKRNIFLSVFLSLITCGLYGIIWGIKVKDEISTICKEYDEEKYSKLTDIYALMASFFLFMFFGGPGHILAYVFSIFLVLFMWSWGIFEQLEISYDKDPSMFRSFLYAVFGGATIGCFTLIYAQHIINKEAE